MGVLITVLKILGILYLLGGIVYTYYLYSSKAETKWWAFPIDILGGPIMFIYIYIMSKKGKKIPFSF